MGDLFSPQLHLRQPEADLIPQHIPAEQESAIAGGADNEIMEFGVESRHFGERLCRFGGLDVLLERHKALGVSMFRSKRGRHRVDHEPHGENFVDVLRTEDWYPGVTGRIKLDQAAELEFDQGLTDRCSADTELCRKLWF